MPFGLKNAGTTYMRAMTTIFHDMIHKEIEVYVDDVIIKSRKSSDHLVDLKNFFYRLRRYNLKLNPTKCAFGVLAGKLLGFIVSRRGIELDPSKIKAIQDLPPPKNRKDVMSFLGRLNYISCFIAQSIVICEPIFKMLRKDATTKWTEECQQAFDRIKEYLSNPPVLKAIKGQALADHLAENPVDEEYKPLRTYFPDEEVLFAGEDILEAYSAKLQFPCTNNMAEYEAYKLGLRMVVDINVQELLVIGNSDLLIHQVQGEWNTKNIKILPYLHCVKELCKKFIKVDFKHVPRVQNEFADALATLSYMIQHPDKNYIDPIKVNVQDQPAYCFHMDDKPDGEPWYYDIKRYLKTRDYPEGATSTQKRTLKRLANHFFLNVKILYRRTPDLGLLRYVDARLLLDDHENKLDLFCTEMSLVSDPRLGHECHCLIESAASKGNRFILVAIDYFTKWVEASSYKSVTKKVVADTVCRFGIRESIITDNGANLNSDLMQEICDKFKITHQNPTPYRPHMNGAVETANKNIQKILRKMIDNYRHWHEKLPFALLEYRTTVRTSTEATPYLLVYGTEAILPAEVEIPSLMVIQEAELSNAEWVKNQYEQLMLIDEKRMNVVGHGQLYQNRMVRAFNKKVKPRQLNWGNWF
uniref:Uncharacterized protein n=1 Tax=Nicotiana tabacum TaxID=4097 RepID=A0A1S4BUM4_TOBAC|nr:PREDICTED: uncharacterized protein LOC107812075 [Nicotiana tabacum]